MGGESRLHRDIGERGGQRSPVFPPCPAGMVAIPVEATSALGGVASMPIKRGRREASDIT